MLAIEDLVFNAWGRRFFDQATVSLPVGAKVGLVGRNGVGKTTLLKLIQGHYTPDRGDITLPKAARIGSVDQEHPATPISLLDTVLAADNERARLNAALETAEPEQLGEHLRAADRDRRRRRPGASERNPQRPRFFDRRPGAPDGGVLRRLAHAGGTGGGVVCRARICCCSTSRRTTSTSKARSGSKRG